jgi:hypothetical protein
VPELPPLELLRDPELLPDAPPDPLPELPDPPELLAEPEPLPEPPELLPAPPEPLPAPPPELLPDPPELFAPPEPLPLVPASVGPPLPDPQAAPDEHAPDASVMSQVPVPGWAGCPHPYVARTSTQEQTKPWRKTRSSIVPLSVGGRHPADLGGPPPPHVARAVVPGSSAW